MPETGRLLLAMIAIAALAGQVWAEEWSVFPEREGPAFRDMGPFVPVDGGVSIAEGDLNVTVGPAGALQIDMGGDSYVVESCWPYPGPDRRIGWNGLPAPFSQDNYPDVTQQLGPEASWQPETGKVDERTVQVAATGSAYRLRRTVRLVGGRVDINDEFTNLRDDVTAIVPRVRVTAREDYGPRYSPGLEVSANPVIFLSGTHSSLGLVMVDSVSRRRVRPYVPSEGNRAGFQINRVALDIDADQTFSWSIYVVKQGEGYFDLVNRVRSDWDTNFTVQGPFAFVYLLDAEGRFAFETSDLEWNIDEVRADPSALRKYLAWKPAKIVALMPWLDYDPGAFDRVITREEYQELMPPLIEALRKADPDIQCIGCIETPYTTLHVEGVEGADKLPTIEVGDPTKLLNEELTDEQAEIIKRGMRDRADSLILSADGKPYYELYVRGGKPIAPAVRVFPQPGNGHARFLREQVEFLIDEVGLDGVYFDMFALGQIGSMRSYLEGKWDGISAETSFDTGEAYGKYIDCSLAAIPVKVELINWLLSRGKVIVANRHSTSREEQALPINRFTETGWELNKMYWEPGTEPPAMNYLFFGQLGSPIGLGINNPDDGTPRAEWLMKGLMTYLRHGQVYYHHTLREGPMSGPGSREFGPMARMFPITPIELGKGFIVARERIISAVSMVRSWSKQDRPVVHLFDMNGRETDPAGKCSIEADGQGRWRVALTLDDWTEIAVVE